MSRKAIGLLLALSLSLIACLPLLAGDGPSTGLRTGPINTRAGGDSPFLLIRLHQLVANLRAGVFPARWMPDAAYGLGYPFFNFYASLPYYIAALFKLCGLGFIWSIKLTQALGFIAAAASMYLLARRLFHREASAILAAVAYTYAPYHLVNVYVRGDALSEFYAFVFYPLIFWALLRLRATREAPLHGCLSLSAGVTTHANCYDKHPEPVEGCGFARAAPFDKLRVLKRLRQCVAQSPIGSIVLLALAYGGLILTHNVSALIFSLFVVLYILLRSPKVSDRGERGIGQRPRPTGTSANLWRVSSVLGLGLGLAISAWFWLPALLEGKYVQLEHQTTGYLNYSNHFRGLNLVQPSPLFDYAIQAGQTPFALGLVQAVLTLLGVAAIVAWWIKRRRPETQSAFSVAGLILATFFITPLSRPLWDNVPLLPFVQFPWRFLSVQAFFASLVIGYLDNVTFAAAVRQRMSLRAKRSNLLRSICQPPWRLLRRFAPRNDNYLGLTGPCLLAGVLGAVLLLTSMLGLEPEYLPIGEADVTVERLMLYEYFTANVGTTIRHEYLPRWVVPRPYTSEILLRAGEKPPPLVMEGEIKAAELVWRKPAAEGWTLDVTSPQASLAFHTYYYPGWRAYVDGQPREVQPVENLGYIGLDLDQGEHEVILRLERTPLRALAEGLSLVAALVVIGLLAQSSKFKAQSSKLKLLVLMVLLGIIGFWILETASPTTRPPDQGPSDLTMDFDRLPYLHHNPQGVNFGGAARLKNYELSADGLASHAIVEAGETVEVVLHWDEVKGKGLADVRLTTPAEYLFHTNAGLAEDSAFILPQRGETEGGETHHRLKVPSEAVRGLYLISVRLRDETGEIRPITERGETLGTTYLRPLRVGSLRWATGDEPTLANFGPGIVLSEVETEQKTPEELETRLAWRVVEPVAANYSLALRLRACPEQGRRDGEGQTLASLDTQPHYGLYPTSLWREGELIDDGYVLPLPEGTPPGDYSLEVILYEMATLAPIGKAQIPDVALTKPTIKATYPVLQQFGPLALVELSPVTAQIEQGQPLVVNAKWAAAEHPTRDYTCRLSLRDESGTTVQSQTQPIARSYATSLWPTDAIVASRYQMTLDPLLPAGRYDLVIAVDDAQTGEGLGELVLPSGIVIKERERSYTIPSMQVKLDISFGDQMRLLGYDLGREGGELWLGLHWQALQQMEGDYKVFVHLFDPATEVIVAQDDAMPRQNQYPTSWWAEGEVVSDEITLSLKDVPPGRYRLALGVYDPQTMDRLTAVSPDGSPIANNRVVLDEEVEVP